MGKRAAAVGGRQEKAGAGAVITLTSGRCWYMIACKGGVMPQASATSSCCACVVCIPAVLLSRRLSESQV